MDNSMRLDTSYPCINWKGTAGAAQKARILLMLALTKTTDRSDIRRMFAEY
jgi:hypothetical protein